VGITLDHVGIISATDTQNADVAAFFADVLGLTVSGNPSEGYAEVNAGTARIALHSGAMDDELRPHGGTLLQFRCDDVRAFVDEVRSRGGTISVPPTETDWGTVSAYIAGPHGVLVEVSQPLVPTVADRPAHKGGSQDASRLT
jgi:predicted enzyme related to lactoylglutathione lyase